MSDRRCLDTATLEGKSKSPVAPFFKGGEASILQTAARSIVCVQPCLHPFFRLPGTDALAWETKRGYLQPAARYTDFLPIHE